jgi:hypothetical protein
MGDCQENGSTVTIKQPVMIQMMPSRNNPEVPMIGFLPYAPYAEDHSIQIQRSAVIWEAKPGKEMYNQYNSVFGSGLIVR